ncbi:hypothetical protein [uncultured Shewanella sp.]|uniref:hypothetical protein n=1 Tax=uncultured Shewanella sp. TaxID=173975 RepID=UPI00260715F7|nr:hypothetical protein [uncultured Shewanella sp.]
MFKRLKIIFLLVLSLSSFSTLAQVQLNETQKQNNTDPVTAEMSTCVSGDSIALSIISSTDSAKAYVSNTAQANQINLLQSQLLQTDSQNVVSNLVNNQAKSKQFSKEKEQPLIGELTNINFFNEVRRVVSSDNRAGVGARPNYFLQIAFFEPIIFNRYIAPIEKPKFTTHWTSQLSSAVSRLSGWKDGNSLYSHHHIRFS